MTPEKKYQQVMRDLRTRKILARGSFIAAIVISCMMIFGGGEILASFLAVGAMWLGVYLVRYITRHGHDIVTYFKTLHHFLAVQDEVQAGRAVAPPLPAAPGLLSDSEQNTFDELVHRLKNS